MTFTFQQLTQARHDLDKAYWRFEADQSSQNRYALQKAKDLVATMEFHRRLEGHSTASA